MRMYSCILSLVCLTGIAFVEETPGQILRKVPLGSVVGAATVIENRSAHDAWQMSDICTLFPGEVLQYISSDQEYVRAKKISLEHTEDRQGCAPGEPIDLYRRIWEGLEIETPK